MDNVINFRNRRDSLSRCEHIEFSWQDVEVSLCPSHGYVTWHQAGIEIDGAEGMAILFGDFDLTGCLPGIGAPGDAVLVYEPGRTGVDRLQAFPAGQWIEAIPGLWFTHDGERLLLAPSDPLVAENLMV